MKSEILDLVAKIVDNNSGGMKFMELLPEVLKEMRERLSPDELLEAIQKDSRFNVFEYHWKLDEETLRVKYFITLTYA